MKWLTRMSEALLCALLVSLAFCGRLDSRATTRADGSAEWRIEGKRIIGCCCGSPCPCRLNKKPMLCHGCDNTTAVHIERGSVQGVSMDGISFIVIGRVFAEDPSRNWVYVYVDQKASPEQQKALAYLLDKGLPPVSASKTPHLVGKVTGMRTVPIEWTVSADGRTWTARIPGILGLKTKSIVLPGHEKPVTSEEIMDNFGTGFTHADTLQHVYYDKQAKKWWDLTGRQSNQAAFVLDAARVAKGGIGWGCWSAHARLGDKSPYQEQMLKHK